MEKVIFYVKNKLKENIDLSKVGLIIRKLNNEEYNDLLNGFKKIILTGEDLNLAKDYYDLKNSNVKWNEEQKIKLFTKISKSENEKIILNIYNGFKGNAFEILTIENIKKELNNFLIAEINSEEFYKHFSENYIYDLIPKIIDFSNYVASNCGDYTEYGISKIYEYKGIKNDDNLINILFMVLLFYGNTCSINELILRKLEKMFKQKNKEFNFSFLMMIDNLLEDLVLVENRIINKVSFLERLLISKEDKKQEAFILKVGILCHDLFIISNEMLSKRLKEIYKIRSLLVHGDSSKIIDNINTYKNVFSETLEKKENKMEAKAQILWATDTILDMLLIRVLNKYLDNPNLCEYIKQN